MLFVLRIGWDLCLREEGAAPSASGDQVDLELLRQTRIYQLALLRRRGISACNHVTIFTMATEDLISLLWFDRVTASPPLFLFFPPGLC